MVIKELSGCAVDTRRHPHSSPLRTLEKQAHENWDSDFSKKQSASANVTPTRQNDAYLCRTVAVAEDRFLMGNRTAVVEVVMADYN